MNRLVSLVVLVALLALLFSGLSLTGMLFAQEPVGAEPATILTLKGEPAVVDRVVDGDTVVLATKEYVRLLGIDTPEKGQPFAKEATDLLRGLVEDKNVTLVADLDDRDKYDRLLRYVFANQTFVNRELIRNGYASVLLIGPEILLADDLLAHEAYAREKGLGIWSSETEACIGIFSLRHNPWGNDNEHLNREWVSFRNKCTHPLDLTGWTLQDSGKSAYVFRPFSLAAKTAVTLHSGPGADNATDLYWGRDVAVWNNDGDQVLLRDAAGAVVLNYTYP
ncbi:MAG: thermonuclease family protein [Candidatus Aenigmarchaeota archaeon]|nr:thermonuclease family protein [Candidatus Aenigmarchaeota archaeon]